MNKHSAYDLVQMQSLPLKYKIIMTKQRIKAWYDYWDGNVYVSIKGGLKMIDDEMYEICKDCPYYYGEINYCMYGEENVPDYLEKKCEVKNEI